MPSYSTNPARRLKPLLPAWVFSILLHSATIALLLAAMQQVPRGGVNGQRGSMGIVLQRSSASDALDQGDDFRVRQAAALIENPPTPALLVASTNAPSESAATKSEAPQQSPKSPASAGTSGAKTTAKDSKPGGQSAARPHGSGGRFGAPGTNGYAQVSVFGVQGKGNKFLYVFDRSASMEGPPLAAAKKQLLGSLQSLDSVHQFHIIFFNTKTQSFDASGGGHRIAFASDRNKKLAANFVGGITADGGTDRMVALREAILFAPDVIFFLTDADDPMTSSELAELERANRKAQAAICVIEFGREPAPAPNDFLAQDSAAERRPIRLRQYNDVVGGADILVCQTGHEVTAA